MKYCYKIKLMITKRSSLWEVFPNPHDTLLVPALLMWPQRVTGRLFMRVASGTSRKIRKPSTSYMSRPGCCNYSCRTCSRWGCKSRWRYSRGRGQHSRCEALPQVDVAWINGNWAPLLTGRWESSPSSNSGMEVREAIPEEQDRPGLSHPHSTNHLHF